MRLRRLLFVGAVLIVLGPALLASALTAVLGAGSTSGAAASAAATSGVPGVSEESGSPPGPVALPRAAPAPAALAAVRFALSQVGVPYLWGGTGVGGYDCSGLVMVAYAHAGIRLPRTANLQYEAGPVISPGAPLIVGDLVFFGPDAADPATVEHVGIYLGRGMIVDAPYTGAFVRVEPMWYSDYVGATRPAG